MVRTRGRADVPPGGVSLSGVKRLLGLIVLTVLAGGLVYGAVVTRREASYWQFVERGDAALARDDSYAAIEALSVAIELKPGSMAAYLKRGEAYRRRNEFDAALRDLRQAAHLDPLATYPRELLGDVHYARAMTSRSSAPGLFMRAVEQYREFVKLDDRSSRAHYKLGLAFYRAGQVPPAIAALRQATQLDPRFAEAHYVLGVCLRASGSRQPAIAALERAVALSPALLAAREELADFYAALGRYDAGLMHLEALAALQPNASRARALGLGYARAGHLDRAVAQLSHAVERFQDDAETYVAVGQVWLERAARSGGRVELSKALQALQGGVNNDSSSEAWTLLGRALLMSGELVRADQVLQQAAARFPVDPEAYRYLADVAARRGRSEASGRALLDYAALVRAESLGSAMLARIAEAHLGSGNPDAARTAVERALKKDPANVLALGLRDRLQ